MSTTAQKNLWWGETPNAVPGTRAEEPTPPPLKLGGSALGWQVMHPDPTGVMNPTVLNPHHGQRATRRVSTIFALSTARLNPLIFLGAPEWSGSSGARFRKTVPKDESVRLEELLTELKPTGSPSVPIRPDLFADESRWFLAAVDAGPAEFRECVRSCTRLRRSGVTGPDEFLTPSGGLRHLYSAPGSENLRLNREYIPHIAAYGYAILQAGYRRDRSSFSRYQSFSRGLISKKAGDSYETDAEFHDVHGRLDLPHRS